MGVVADKRNDHCIYV